jgi:23S rRNA-/tRNA-specific pseudouridylate synthase
LSPLRQRDDLNSKIDTSDSVFSSVVRDEHDGKRLKWYLRHSFGKDAGLSKQQCERMIKIGRVALNSTVVVDSGRFLHTGDKMIILPEPSTADGTISESVVMVEIHRESENVVVAFNPVGMRTIGSFSAQTLEMVVSAQTRESFKAVSKLDTGCCGLCVLSRDGAAVKEVSRVFTALVHGRVPDSWNGLSLPLPIESMRRW